MFRVRILKFESIKIHNSNLVTGSLWPSVAQIPMCHLMHTGDFGIVTFHHCHNPLLLTV